MPLFVTRTARTGRWLWEWTKSIAAALVVWFLVSTFLVQAFRIPSGSMERTVLIGDFLFVNKLLYGAEVPLTQKHLPAVREPRHDEVIVVRSPVEDLILIKRVVALSGDTIAMQDGVLFRNGLVVPEPYVTLHRVAPTIDTPTADRMRRWQLPFLAKSAAEPYRPDLRNWGPLVVPPDSLMALGDNRDESLDSRYYGFIPRRNFRGAPLFIYYSYDPSSWRPLSFVTAVRWRRLFSAPF